jgi:hypothetical protein
MAKSRLVAKVNFELDAFETAIEAALEKVAKDEPVNQDLRQKIMNGSKGAFEAIDALKKHMENLERRENNPKLGDRLRNLKNVFKDKAQLSQDRKKVRDGIADMQAQFVKLRGEMVTALEDFQEYETVVLRQPLQGPKKTPPPVPPRPAQGIAAINPKAPLNKPFSK